MFRKATPPPQNEHAISSKQHIASQRHTTTGNTAPSTFNKKSSTGKMKKKKKKLTDSGRIRKARHNEKDDRVYYCDYCDKFVGTSQAVRMQHNKSTKHIECLETYYSMAQLDAPDEVADIRSALRDSALASVAILSPSAELRDGEASHQRRDRVGDNTKTSSSDGLVAMLPPTKLSSQIVVGGVLPTADVAPIVVSPSIRVGNVPLAPSQVLVGVAAAPAINTSITVAGRRVMPPINTTSTADSNA